MKFSCGAVWWGREFRRKAGVKLIGTIHTFGWRWRMHRSLGLQISLGVWHCWFAFDFS